MRYRFVLIGLLAFVSLGLTRAAFSRQGEGRVPEQQGQQEQGGRGRGARAPDGQGLKPSGPPAPRHDLSGIWAPARGPGAGIQAGGVAIRRGSRHYSQPYSSTGSEDDGVAQTPVRTKSGFPHHGQRRSQAILAIRWDFLAPTFIRFATSSSSRTIAKSC